MGMPSPIIPRSPTVFRGRDAETLAWAWLSLQAGSRRLLEKNFRKKTGEIDLIFEETLPSGGRHAICLVFLEVRSRVDPRVRPIDSVDATKRARIEKTALQFWAAYRGGASQIRFDCVEVRGGGRDAHPEFVWWPNAW